MKILLLGAAGFIGTNLTIELAKKTEDEITLVDRSKAFFKPIVSMDLKNVHILEADLTVDIYVPPFCLFDGFGYKKSRPHRRRFGSSWPEVTQTRRCPDHRNSTGQLLRPCRSRPLRTPCIFVIVEGPTDEDALSSVLKQIFSSAEVHFHVIHGDITTEDAITANNAKSYVAKRIAAEMKKYA